MSTRVRLNLSPDLQVSSSLQYDNDSRTVGANTSCDTEGLSALGATQTAPHHDPARYANESDDVTVQ